MYMIKYIAKIKEVGHQNVLISSLTTDTIKSKSELISFWGLEESDVEYYKLYQVKDGEEEELL